VEDEEPLESRAVVGEVSDSIKDNIDELLSDSVVSSGVCRSKREGDQRVKEGREVEGRRTVVGRILLSRDQGLGVEERLVGSSSDFVDDVGLEVDLSQIQNKSNRTSQSARSFDATTPKRKQLPPRIGREKRNETRVEGPGDVLS